MCVVLLLFLGTSARAEESKSSSTLPETSDLRLIQFNWDIILKNNIDITNSTHLTSTHELIHSYLTYFENTFIYGLAHQINLTPRLTNQNTLLMAQLIDPKTVRFSTYYDSKGEGYKSYQRFHQATTQVGAFNTILFNVGSFNVAGDATNSIENVSTNSFYLPFTCGDLIKNAGESDIDCGGSTTGCPRCDVGMDCEHDESCIEFSTCINIDPKTKLGKCSPLQAGTPVRKFELNRTNHANHFAPSLSFISASLLFFLLYSIFI